MLDKNTWIKIAIVLVAFVGISLYSQAKFNQTHIQNWLICTYNTPYENYEETLKFNFIEGIMYEYERIEVMDTNKKAELTETYNETYEKIKNHLDDDLRYELSEKGDKVEIYTYIKTLNKEGFFNNYMQSKNISFNSNINRIKEVLKEEYTCHKERS